MMERENRRTEIPEYTRRLAAIQWQDLPPKVQRQAKRCLKDILATSAGSAVLPAPRQALPLIESQYGSGTIPLWFRGRSSSRVGAAFFNAFAVDCLDCHDGFRLTKGHAGATVVPVAVGIAAETRCTGAELLTAIALGYEIACRAGLALHQIYAPAVHSSGAWAALGAAAAGAKLLQVPAERLDPLLGVAEYYAPVSPIMRCTEYPCAVKDGAAGGAWAAAHALTMDACALAGLPSLFADEAAGREQIATLGDDWMILRQYFKPYPTCRWTHPAVEAVWHLQAAHRFPHECVASIVVETFGAALTLVTEHPRDPDEAQYSMPWAVAAALVDGCLGVGQVHPDRLSDPTIRALAQRVKMVRADDIDRRFPAECLARVTVTLDDGRCWTHPAVPARGDYVAPLTDEDMNVKLDSLVEPALGYAFCRHVSAEFDALEQSSVEGLLELLHANVDAMSEKCSCLDAPILP
ncbi:MAG: MmgE/PrpD family protein [Pirellulales bacterium]|nr:MmgE/PrpD family protein [Pirellulales bacterium]